MPRRTPLTVGAAVFLLIIAGALLLPRMSWKKYASDLKTCLEGAGCSGMSVLAGPNRVSAAQLDEVFTWPEVKAGSRLIKNAVRRQMDEVHDGVFITADVGQGDQVFVFTTIRTPDGPALPFGEMLLKVLALKCLKSDPGVNTAGKLYDCLGGESDVLSSKIVRAGIRKIEVGGHVIDVADMPAALRKLGEFNRDKPLRVIRP